MQRVSFRRPWDGWSFWLRRDPQSLIKGQCGIQWERESGWIARLAVGKTSGRNFFIGVGLTSVRVEDLDG